MKLYSYWRSSCSWRARIALAHKDLDYEIVPVHLVRGGGEQHAGEYAALNPMRQVPTLVTSAGETITQSLAIVEYAEELRPEPTLLPGDALARARARELAAIIATGTQPLQNISVLREIEALGGDRGEWGRRHIERGLAALEARADPAGPLLCGARVTIADAVLVPQLYNARRFGVDTAAYAALARAEEAALALPSFYRTRPEAQPDAEPAGSA